jgi:phosphohistidine swiveling domain-containing protein
LDCPEGFSAVHESPFLREIDFNSLVAISDGSEHVRIEEMATLGAGLIRASVQYPSLFQDIGNHYERLIEEWIAYSAQIGSMNLGRESNAGLSSLLSGFVDHYKAFSPILFVPFIVEKRYASEYPALLDRLADRVMAAAKDAVGEGQLGLLARTGALSLADDARDLRDALRGILEYSPRRTIAEQKEDCLQRLAALVERDSVGRDLFSASTPPDAAAIADQVPHLARELGEVFDEFRWLAHWGYPPKFHDATEEDFIDDIHLRVRRGAVAALEAAERQRVLAQSDLRILLDLIPLEPSERQLIDDINYYNYLRTARMEAKIRAQYLSIPLFEEIQRRGEEAGALGPNDIYLMVPPETQEFLLTGVVPEDLPARRDGWTLVTHAARHEWRVYSGESKREFEDGFYSVIDWRENARGLHNPTSSFVGGKGSGLFRLVEAGCDVPPFFVVTTEAFRRFIRHNNLAEPLRELVLQVKEDPQRGADLALRCRDLIKGGEVPTGTFAAITELVPQLGAGRLAVRSSATVEDAEEFSWAGRFETILDVTAPAVPDAIKQVWASLFTERALAYAHETGVDLAATSMAVVIQAMVTADVAGVINTVFDGATDGIVEIEAALGYGAPIVEGEITPDRYLFDVTKRAVVDRHIAVQDKKMGPGGWVVVDGSGGGMAKISDEVIATLAEIAKRIEKDLGGPQDIEFAIESGRISIVQSRPLTGLDTAWAAAPTSSAQLPHGAKLVATGLKGKTADVWRGRCQVLTDLSQAKDFKDGNILVVTAATPAWDPVVFRASALITDDGGATSHAIRVANERRIPVVVGTTSATETIQDGGELIMDTSSDPFRGRVYLVP